MNKRMIVMLIACTVIFGGIFGFKWFGKTMMNKSFDNMPFPPAAITATEAVQDNWALSLGAVGTVKAINGVEVTTQAAGEVEKIHFKSGDRVEAGDVLITLDDRTDKAQLKALQAAAKLAEQEYQRHRKLFKQGSISKSLLDQKLSEKDQAEAQAAAQREKVAQKTLRAPFSGQLGIRQVDLGQYLSPGTPVVTLQQLDPIYVNFSLPEQELEQVKTGLKVQAQLSAWPDKAFEGEITAVEPGVDPNTRNFNLQATFDNAEQLLRPGMFARIQIQLPQTEDVVVIPRTAISYSPYGNSVFVISEEAAEGAEPRLVAKSRFVQTGRERGDLVTILDGLKPGERVATSGLLKLRNGASVIINNKVEPSAEAQPQPDNS